MRLMAEDLSLSYGSTPVVDRVARRELELGIVGAARRHRSVTFEPFFRDEVVLACPPSHPFAGRTIPLDELRPEPLILSLGVSVGLAAVFTVIRLLQKSPPSAAIGGLVAAGAAAVLALWTGRGADNFVPGLITNAVYGTAMIVAALVGWSLIGLAVGFLMGEGTAWRQDRRKRRAFFWLGIAWGVLFYARLGVQLPLYLTDQVTLLGTLKLIMGLPLFAPLVAVTWLVVRALYRRGE